MEPALPASEVNESQIDGAVAHGVDVIGTLDKRNGLVSQCCTEVKAESLELCSSIGPDVEYVLGVEMLDLWELLRVAPRTGCKDRSGIDPLPWTGLLSRQHGD